MPLLMSMKTVRTGSEVWHCLAERSGSEVWHCLVERTGSGTPHLTGRII
jgi:hypothetical protein